MLTLAIALTVVLASVDRYMHDRYARLRVAVLVSTVAFGLLPGTRR